MNTYIFKGIHLFRSGRFLQFSNVPFILIVGGTDVNIMINDKEKNDTMTKALKKTTFIVCFTEILKQK